MLDELRVSPTACPSCETELKVFLKANWVYTVLSCSLGLVVAYFQGYESIVCAFWALFYAMVILLAIKFYRWELHLPIKIVEKPDLSLFPKDMS